MNQDVFLSLVADYGLMIVVALAVWGIILGIRERVDPGSKIGRILGSRPRPGQERTKLGSSDDQAGPPEA